MICISVTPKSRQLAKVDLINAARNCDLIELCLDHLIKEPDFADLFAAVDKPIIVSCRRAADGGHWEGSEEDRLGLLRKAIVAGPAYVELELDVAKNVPRFGETRRIIAYNSPNEPLKNVDEIFDQAWYAKADVVKFTWPTPTLDTAWPLLAAVTKKRELPVVGIGLGEAGRTFSLLGRKFGSPWVYAALEKGMEAHPGQATVWELDEVYRWNDIERKTRFVGVAGYGEADKPLVRALNDGFRAAGLDQLCLPMELGGLEKLGQMLDVLKVNAVLVGPAAASEVIPFAAHVHTDSREGGTADILLNQPDGWHAYASLWRSVIRQLEDGLGRRDKDDRPLDRRNVLIIGVDPVAQSVAYGVRKRKGVVSVTGRNDERAKALAKRFDLRHVPFANLYDTLADVVLLTDPGQRLGHHRTELNPSYLRSTMTVADLSHLPEETPLIEEARQRGSRVVESRAIFDDYVSATFKSLTGRDLPEAAASDQ